MPTSPKRPCSQAGCPELTYGRYCPKHQRQMDAQYNKYQRDPETRRRYGRAWQKIRRQHLAEHPLCEQCRQDGVLTPAEQVHHILPLSQGGSNDPANLMSLCVSCHSAITMRENNRVR